MREISRSAVLAFSIGSIGAGIYLTVPSVLLLYYLTQELTVSPALAGAAVFIPRVWDLATDPLMGWISDRTRSPMGRRRPYLLAGGLLTALSFGFLFSAPPLASETQNFVYVLVVYMLSATAYTVFAVPYLSMPAEMSSDTDERATIMAYRMTFAMIGVLVGSAAAPTLVELFGGGHAGFAGMSWTLGGVCAATMLLAFFGTARAPVISAPPSGAGATSMFAVFADARFRTLGAAYFLQIAALGVFSGAAPYLVSLILGRSEGDISIVFVALLGGTLVSLFIWERIARRYGKIPTYVAAALACLAGVACVGVIDGPQGWPFLLCVTTVVGFGFGGLQLMPFAMLTDVIHLARSEGNGDAGAYTGIWTAVEKGGLALGPLIVGLFLSAGGFVSGGPDQSAEALFWIRLSAAVAPASLIIASLPVMLRYDRLRS